MSMPAMKTEVSAVAIPPAVAAAPVVTMTPKRAPRAETYARMVKETAAHVVPPLIVIALLLVIAQPWLSRRLAARRPDGEARPDPWWLWLGVLATGIYGGYFGAAQGVVLLAMMGVALAEPLQRVNAVKNVLAMLANLVSGLVFVFVAHVSWTVVLLIAVGSGIGGVLGARIGRRLSPVVLRGAIVVIGLAALGKLLL